MVKLPFQMNLSASLTLRPFASTPQVIKGWTEAMQLMVQGDKWEMYIPPDLAYGERAMGRDIPAGSTLVFTMEIMKIKGATKPKAEL